MTEVFIEEFSDEAEAEAALINKGCDSDWILTEIEEGTRWVLRKATAEEMAWVDKEFARLERS